MLTNNFKQALKSCNASINSMQSKPYNYSLTDTDNETQDTIDIAYNKYLNLSVFFGGTGNYPDTTTSERLQNAKGKTYDDVISRCWRPFLLLGSGKTKPTKEDYRLENLIDTYDCIDQSVIIPTGVNEPYFVISRMVKNNTEENIEINEMGLFNGSEARGSKIAAFMFAREVLDEPVILKPGESYIFTLTLDI